MLAALTADLLSWTRWHSGWAAATVRMTLSVGSQDSAAREALAAWNGAGSDFRFTSTDSAGETCGIDGRNSVVFSADACGDDWGGRTLAITTIWFDPTGRPVEADVAFNANRSWSVYGGPWRSDPADFRRVALHEFGHVLGLGHPDDAGQSVTAIMNSRIGALESLQPDDIDGLLAIYNPPPPPPPPPPPAPPDLVVRSPSVNDSTPVAGAAFTLSAAVRNQGTGASPATTLRYYRSTDATVTTSDTEEANDAVERIAAAGISRKSVDLTAPSTPGIYHYGACVDAVPDESDADNNCSTAVQVTVAAPPDLVVDSVEVSDGTPTPGQAFTLSATVLNRGEGASEAATLTYRERPNGGQSWTAVGTDAVGGLSASGTSAESIRLTAPAQAGAYEYGACVSAVSGESVTDNNCSEAVEVRVTCAVDPLGPVSGAKRVTGSWGSDCPSSRRSGRFARYYSFIVNRSMEVRVDLTSTRDPYLYLLDGSGTDGALLASNDDVDPGSTRSRIVRRLPAGTYTVEATTSGAGVTGSFALRVREWKGFTDAPLAAGTAIKAVHVTELREQIDDLRVSLGLPRYSWVDPVIRPGVTPVKAVHLEQLRRALDAVYDGEGRRRPRYAGAVESGAAIEAGHVNELRRAVEGL